MSGENHQIFRISQFSSVDMHSNILKLWEYGEEFWNEVFCILSPGALLRLCMNPDLLKNTLRKKEMQHSNILKGCISVTLHVLKLLSIAREPETIL